MTGHARLVALLVLACVVVVGASTVRPTSSSWTDTTTNAGILITAAPDWEAPALGTAVVGKSTGGVAGYIHKGATYYVYANVTDGGNPASGTSAVTSSVSSITSGQSAVVLSAGSFTAQGVSYNRRSAILTAGATLAAGSYATTITSTDVATNAATVTGPAATVDNTPPTGSAIHMTNGSGVAGRPDSGDLLTYTWSEQVDAYAMLASWSGAATAVRVVITDGLTTNDTVTIRTTAGTTLPFGSADLNSNHVLTTSTFDATMTQVGAAVTVTLGALVSGLPNTSTAIAAITWATGTTTGATDRAGNALTASTVTESGTADYEF
jgi:hypothetical protein